MNKELDALLVEGVDKDGYTLKFTLRGENVEELKNKLDALKTLWFEDLKPQNTVNKGYVGSSKTYTTATQQQVANTGNYGACKSCGSPNKMSKAGKIFCSQLCWTKKTY